jgi:hypothetical protein
MQSFGGIDADEFRAHGVNAFIQVNLGTGELPGGDIQVGNAGTIFLQTDGREVIVPARVSATRFTTVPGVTTRIHLPREQAFIRLPAHLLRDGDPVALSRLAFRDNYPRHGKECPPWARAHPSPPVGSQNDSSASDALWAPRQRFRKNHPA